jgi:hypothetical protein
MAHGMQLVGKLRTSCVDFVALLQAESGQFSHYMITSNFRVRGRFPIGDDAGLDLQTWQ